MKRPLAASTILLLLLSPAAIQAANLRAASLINDELDHHDHERRRLAIASYWTESRIKNAIARDVKVNPNDFPSRRLEAADDGDNSPLPRNLLNPNQYLIQMDDDKFMECTVTHKPFSEDEEDERRLAVPQDTHLFPRPNAVVDTEFIEFKVDVYDEQNDLRKIVFFLKDMQTNKMKKTRIRARHGNGEYTFRMGPFTDGDYKWAVRVINGSKKKSRRNFENFTVQRHKATEPPPPATTPTLPADSDELNFARFSPPAETQDPVSFEWSVTGGDIALVYLFVRFPNGSQGYLSRDPTLDGHDGVSVNLEEAGRFKWHIKAIMNSGKVVEGPEYDFEIDAPPGNPTCAEDLGHYTDRDQHLHKAVGRIMFRFGKNNYLCSGTLVDGENDRVIIATAAHCVFDSNSNSFPTFVMFIPGQDDGEGDRSDTNCSNDPHGCFYPTIGVISEEYKKASFVQSFQYDYGFYVAKDTDLGNNNRPVEGENGGKQLTSLIPMGISFDGLAYNANTHLFGYPGARDPYFMYTEGYTETSPVTNGGWYVDCSGLTGGASGGPWTQSDPETGEMVVGSVNSWGWSNGNPGMGSPPYGVGAKCVYDAANGANLDGGDIVASCPK